MEFFPIEVFLKTIKNKNKSIRLPATYLIYARIRIFFLLPHTIHKIGKRFGSFLHLLMFFCLETLDELRQSFNFVFLASFFDSWIFQTLLTLFVLIVIMGCPTHFPKNLNQFR